MWGDENLVADLIRGVLLDPPLWSSSRRFRSLGNLRTSVLYAVFIIFFSLGVCPDKLHRWYYRTRFDPRKDCSSAADRSA